MLTNVCLGREWEPLMLFGPVLCVAGVGFFGTLFLSLPLRRSVRLIAGLRVRSVWRHALLMVGIGVAFTASLMGLLYIPSHTCPA